VTERVIAFLLIAEAMFGALRLAQVLPRLGFYDALAQLLIVVRGLVCAMEFAGGWMLAERRQNSARFAGLALLASAALTPLDVGLNLAPNDVFPTYRWSVTIGYGVLATAAAWLLFRRQ
jgi:hypothetical protein